jgi:membrane protease YdiL (CAAX protease family)
MEFKDLSRKSQWIALAVMSGACAAFNGVFAKLYVVSFLILSQIFCTRRTGGIWFYISAHSSSVSRQIRP